MDLARLISHLCGRDLSPAFRVWSALAPALLVTAWFLLGLAAFSLRSALWGMPRDAETASRGASVLVRPFLRHYFFWLLRPLWRLVTSTGVPPTALTTSSVLLGLGAGAAAAAGRFALAGWLFIFSGVLDALDGRLARWRGQATPWGAAIDSTLDRIVDGAVLIGLAWYYRASWVLAPCLAAMLGTAMVPYVRARGEALGVMVKDGLMQRVERIMLLGVGMALSPVLEALAFPGERRPMHWLAVVALVVLAVTSNYTGLARLVVVVRTLQARAGVRSAPLRSRVRRAGLNLLASALATAVDFVIAVFLVHDLGLSPTLATAAGASVGALTSFGLNRMVTFRSRDESLPQLGRYALVSLGSLGLNSGGVGLLLSLPGLPYVLAWWLVRAAVFALWNYPLHKEYVFGAHRQAPASEATRAPNASARA